MPNGVDAKVQFHEAGNASGHLGFFPRTFSEVRAVELRLVSKDAELHKLCREILAEVFGGDASLSISDPDDYAPGSGVSVWDFSADMPLPASFRMQPSRHLVLVDKADLADFYEQAGAKYSTVLLKPVTRATLAAFLSFAAAVENSAPATSVRADRDDILQCLIQTNLRLQEYDQGRTNFIARAMHDFRAPLTALCGYCDFLLAEPLGSLNTEQKEVLRRMLRSTKRLSRMAASMLHLSVAREATPRPELRKGDLRDCVEQALYEITPFAEEKRHALTVDLNPSIGTLFFEPKQIEQVLINLLDNACKFTPKAGAIEIRGYPYFWERRRQSGIAVPQERRRSGSREPNAYRVDIRDSGTCIPPDQLGLIFEEYVSSDRSGTGLGLAICRAMITQHSGSIWAENTEAGPMFSFVLPFGVPTHLADSHREAAYSEVA